LPVLICFLPIGHTLMRGQANVIGVAMLCAAMAVDRGKLPRGPLLAFAICIKVNPALSARYRWWKTRCRGLWRGSRSGVSLARRDFPSHLRPDKTMNPLRDLCKAFFGPFFGVHQDDRSRERNRTTDSIGSRTRSTTGLIRPEPSRPEDMNAWQGGLPAARLWHDPSSRSAWHTPPRRIAGADRERIPAA